MHMHAMMTDSKDHKILDMGFTCHLCDINYKSRQVWI
jgi:hypothetical protein